MVGDNYHWLSDVTFGAAIGFTVGRWIVRHRSTLYRRRRGLHPGLRHHPAASAGAAGQARGRDQRGARDPAGVPARRWVGQAARAALGRIEAQLQLARDRVALEVRDALSALAAARERISFTRQEVSVSTKLEKGERTRFELGDSTLLFVNLREQATAEARLREVDSLTEHHKAAAALRAALAQSERK